jgi:catechol 2,3-dioxygenase-like lactoylglutathione lyase family enzyme
MIARLDNAGIAVRDLRRAFAFYTETLGLAGELGEGDAWVHLGNADLYLFETQGNGAASPARGPDLATEPPGLDHLAFQVTGRIEEACAALEARGVAFAGPVVGAAGEFRYRGFSDPEGNMLYVVERPA